MNNHGLLAGLLCAALPGIWTHCIAQRVINLDEIFAVAETNSAKLRSSYAYEQEAEKGITVSRTARLPEINVGLTLSYNGDGFTTDRNFGDYQKAPIPHFGNTVGITVTQPVFTGGAITNSIHLAELKSTASRFTTDFKRDDLRFHLAGFYLDIYKYSNLKTVVENNLVSARKVLDEMHAKYDQGTALLNDITRYELLVSNLEVELVRISNTLKILNDNLVTLSGLDPGTFVEPDTTLLAKSLEAPGLAAWQADASACSPRLKLAENGINLGLASEKLAQADRLPKVGLQAGWVFDGPVLTEVPPINRNLSYWYVGVNVSYNISSLFKTDKSVTKSRAATFAARQELESVREDVALAVSEAHIRWEESKIELKSREKGVELARRNYNTVSTRYGAGMALITDLLDAANSRLDSEQQLVNARINIIYSYYRLLFTTGKI